MNSISSELNQEWLDHVEGFRQSDILTDEQQKQNFRLGLLCEIGELGDHFKKHHFHGDPLDTVKVTKEAGDVLFYLYALMQVSGIQDVELPKISTEESKAKYNIPVDRVVEEMLKSALRVNYCSRYIQYDDFNRTATQEFLSASSSALRYRKFGSKALPFRAAFTLC